LSGIDTTWCARSAAVRLRPRSAPAAAIVSPSASGDVVVEELLVPDHPGERLTQDVAVLRRRVRRELVVEHRGFRLPPGEHHVGVGERPGALASRQNHADSHRMPGLGGDDVPGGELRSRTGRVDGIGLAVDDRTMEGVLDG
jgi:hypothetical protein